HDDPADNPFDARAVLVVDEASTLSDRDLDQLMWMTASAGATMRLIVKRVDPSSATPPSTARSRPAAYSGSSVSDTTARRPSSSPRTASSTLRIGPLPRRCGTAGSTRRSTPSNELGTCIEVPLVDRSRGLRGQVCLGLTVALFPLDGWDVV